MITKIYKFKLIIIILIALLVIGAVSTFQSHHTLSITNHTLASSKLTDSIRILQLTDLHNSEFGEENGELIELCDEQNPDIILLTGDLVNMDEPNTNIATVLISKLTNIAPVYVSLGNHELANEATFGNDLIKLYEQAGATVLEQDYIDISINDQDIRLGGIYGYCLPSKYLVTGEALPEECDFLYDFQDTEDCTILMCHMPVTWLINGSLEEWDVDYVFSGHAHGGQIILPFIGGMYAPDMGYFPGNLKGVFSSEDNSNHLILSSGLGSGTCVPRINNKPEIVVVDIINENIDEKQFN